MFKPISLLLGSLLLLGLLGCGGKEKNKDKDTQKSSCTKLYDKVETCSKEVKLLEEMGKAFGSKEKFVTECKANWSKAEEMTKCVDKSDCREFTKCLLKMSDEDLKKLEDFQRQ